ncbi:YjbE family putative metal transport protein [Polynucleobacter sp. AP-Jannik-300A-C4]|nr:YjbE family putative metal transport protein [Polynucleobacter sp. AP-Jannik-300A-C4]
MKLELFSPEFFSALLAIIVIDLVLAGDNAIVIAMAARNLPAHLQKKAIIWGAVGAIAVRSAMTLVVVYLLKIPGLMLIGGLLLVWIAYRLLNPEQESDEHGQASTTFWGAMKTIVVADAIMGLDNVLAVAGASHGSYVLVVLGLLISIPVVIWGSTQILKLVERYPSVTYLGAGVLAWTAAKMMISEPISKEWLASQSSALEYVIQVAVVLGVLASGFIRSRRALEGVIAPSVVVPESASMVLQEQPPNFGENKMNKILIPVDGSKNSDLAVKHAVKTYGQDSNARFYLCNVQPTLYRHIGKYLSKQTINEWHAERATLAAASASAYLEKHGLNFSFSYACGDKGSAIRDEATRLECSRIVIGTSKKNSLSRLFENSTTAKLLEISDIPVEVVTGSSLPALERWGIPALGAGAATALMAVVID